MLQPTQKSQHTSSHRPQNVGEVDRWISGILGSGFMLSGLRRGGIRGLICSGIGSALLYRSVTGHCPMQERIDMDAGRSNWRHPKAPAETIAGAHKQWHVRPPSKEPPDKVQEAGEESFPASDPPAWNPETDRFRK